MKQLARLSTAGLVVLLLGGLAISGAVRSVLLFKGTFDAPYFLPEAGQFVLSSSVGSIGLTPALGGGNQLVFDDTNTTGNQPLYLLGTFEGGKHIHAGTVHMHLEMTLGQADSPFAVGVVVDNATSDFIPTGGPDADGDLTIAGKKTGKNALVDTPLTFDVALTRDRTTEDWRYAISVTTPTEPPSGKSPTPVVPLYTGTYPGTAGKAVSGIAFVKLPGSTGRFLVDDILVEQTSP